MQIRTFSRLVGALAYLFGKVQVSEDTGVVVVSSFWLGKYWVLTETHLTKRSPDSRWAVGNCPRCHCIFDVELPAKSG
jgi:hypothetical protein